MSSQSREELFRAIMLGDLSTIAEILERNPDDAMALDRDGFSPLIAAVLASSFDVAVFNCILARSLNVNYSERSKGWSALHFAARDANELAIQALLAAGADPNLRNEMGQTPLHLGVKSPRFSRDSFDHFIRAGADVDLESKSGVSVRSLVRMLKPDWLEA